MPGKPLALSMNAEGTLLLVGTIYQGGNGPPVVDDGRLITIDALTNQVLGTSVVAAPYVYRVSFAR